MIIEEHFNIFIEGNFTFELCYGVFSKVEGLIFNLLVDIHAFYSVVRLELDRRSAFLTLAKVLSERLLECVPYRALTRKNPTSRITPCSSGRHAPG